MKELFVAEKACLEAGKIALKYFQKEFTIRHKGEKNIVTQADVECEREIKELISKKFPSHAFIGEEEGPSGDSENVWVIDPIDGTTNFAHGVDQFAHSVAFTKRGKVLCGAVYNPVQKKLFTACAGKGAYLNGKKIHVSKVSRLIDSLLVSGFPYDVPDLEEKTFSSMRALRPKCQDIRRFGSASLDTCYVGQGICEAFFEYRLNSWDIAAAMLVAREAGGKVTDINGKEAHLNSGHFLASNGLLHDEILGYLERV